MRLRSRRRRREESIDDLLPRFDEEGRWAEPVSAEETSTDGLLERRETRTMVRAAIERLPLNYRSVRLLRDIEELDTEETAALLGVTPNAVKTRRHRARQALRALLRREFHDERSRSDVSGSPRSRMPFHSRAAVSAIFFINGVVLASWVPHIPAVKARHAMSDGELGIVLLSMAVGAVCALPIAGWLVGRAGSRLVTSAAAIALCLALPLPLLSPNVLLLSLSLVVLGACNATLDVSMNAQAVAVERGYGRAIMSSFHGLFSLGGLVGAGMAGGVMALGVGDLSHITGTSVVCLLTVASCLPRLVPSSVGDSSPGGGFARPTRALLGLGALAFCGLLAEGAMGDWSAVYLHDALGSSAAVAATAFASFSLTMAAGRFGGDRLVVRFGPGRVLRASSAVAAIGLAVALVMGTPTPAIIGCGLVGLGISNVIPILFSAAGRVPGTRPGTALAAVATVGYFGFIAGPPMIGLAAEVAGLRVALGIVSALCALITVGGGVAARTEPHALHRESTVAPSAA